MLKLVTGNLSAAMVQCAGRGAVTLVIDPEHRWNAGGLRKLASALEGVAGVLDSQDSR